MNLKQRVHDFWDAASCGEVYASGESPRERLEAQAAERYRLEPYLAAFARFPDGRGLDVLEIGVGMGADHLEWARQRPRSLTGVDFTHRALAHTAFRLSDSGFAPRLAAADAEALPFDDGSFDLVYSWGVIHHTPDTAAAAREIHRVLRPGGRARVMIYHSASITAALLWLRYALGRGRPFVSLREIAAEHLESPGTKLYSVPEARQLFSMFSDVNARTMLSLSDLLDGAAGQRHGGAALAVARALWPRPLIRRLLPGAGLDLLIDAVR